MIFYEKVKDGKVFKFLFYHILGIFVLSFLSNMNHVDVELQKQPGFVTPPYTSEEYYLNVWEHKRVWLIIFEGGQRTLATII